MTFEKKAWKHKCSCMLKAADHLERPRVLFGMDMMGALSSENLKHQNIFVVEKGKQTKK